MKRIYEHRLAITLVVLAVVAVLMALGPARDAIAYMVERATPLIEERPIAGALIFVGLGVVSAMLSFVSSIALVPVAVSAWGPAIAAVLLWGGWFIGGILTYHIGRYLGQPVVRRLASPARLARFKHLISRETTLPRAVAVMVAMPSDIAGYLFGTLDFPRRRFIAALAIAEAPYAFVAAYIGDAFIGERPWIALTVVAVGVALIAAGRWKSAQKARSRTRSRRRARPRARPTSPRAA